MNPWQYIKADGLFRDLVPEIKNYKRKILGTNTKGAALSFTDEEKQLINSAIQKIPDLYYWLYIKAEPFFADFLPEIKNYKQKISGKNTRGNPLDFSDDEKRTIAKAIKRLTADLISCFK
ncbi:MAG: hypothetical protein ACTHMM_27025 [Agriterribacter sp.]